MLEMFPEQGELTIRAVDVRLASVGSARSVRLAFVLLSAGHGLGQLIAILWLPH